MSLNEAAPEGATTISAEGEDIKTALAAAATELGVDAGGLRYEVDKSWFRNENGSVVPRDTVKVIVWQRDASEVAVIGDTSKWMTELLKHLEIDGQVNVALADAAVAVRIRCDKAGRLVGRRGRTLQAVEHLLAQSVGADHPDARFRIDVADTRKREDRDERGGRRDRGERRDRGDRGERRDRGDRGERRDRGDRRDKQDDARNQRRLEDLAKKIAKRVAKSGESEVVRKELNSFDRRIVHVTIAEVDGVGTRSIGDGNHKQIEIYPLNEFTDDDTSTDEVTDVEESVEESVEASEGTEASA